MAFTAVLWRSMVVTDGGQSMEEVEQLLDAVIN